MQEEYKQQRKELSKALQEVVKELRQKNIKSATMLALEIGMSKTTILTIEKGKGDPQLSTFCRIAEALDIKPSKFLNLIEKKLPENWSFLDK